MNGGRSRQTALLAAALVLAWAMPAGALVNCLVPIYGDSLEFDREGYEPVPDEVLPDAFNEVFDLYVYWDWGTEEWWPDEEVIAFAGLVMPDSTGPETLEDSYGHRTAYMFGVDAAAAYDSICFDYNWGGGHKHHEHFDIFIHGGVGSYASYDHVVLGLQNAQLTAEEVAKDHFAHEWGHVSYFSTGATGGNGCPSFGEEWVSGSYWDHGTHEFMAKSSEFFNGMVAEDWYGSFLEQPLNAGIGRNDWYEDCQIKVGGGHVDGSDRRWVYFPFTAYLQDHFNDEGLFYDWTHTDACDSANVGPHDFDYLALRLHDNQYAGSFSETTGDARLRELFREYALSMWVNTDQLFEDNPEASVLMPLHEGASPRENFGFFQLKDDDYCQDDALSQPYYVDVTETPIVVEGALYGSDFGCEDQDLFNFRRELSFDSYAWSILPFRADAEILDSGRCYDLEVRVVLGDSVLCYTGNDYLEWEASENDYLHFWVLGYPEHTDSLDIYGDEAVLLGEVAYNNNFAAGDTLAFTVPCFGSAFKAVTLVASLTEVTASSGTANAHVIPYHYVCWAEDKSGDRTIATNTTWATEDGPVCLGGLVTVDSGVTLEVEPGVALWCADADSSGVTAVGFAVEGTLDLAGTSQAGIRAQPILDQWDGITVADDGVLLADYLTASGFDYLLCDATAAEVELTNSTFTLGPSTTGFDFTDAAVVAIEDCEFHEATTLRLADHSLQDSKIYQREGTIWPAVSIDGDADLDSVVIYSAHVAVKVLGGEPTLDAVSANSNGSTSCSREPTLGLALVSDADVTAAHCTFEGFCQGVRLDDTANLVLRNSAIVDAEALGVYLDDQGVHADLGYILDPPVAGMLGDNCIATADPADLRVFNRSSSTCLAVSNYWGTSTPTSGLFSGSVAWTPYDTSCTQGAGGPDFSLIALPAPAASPPRFGLPVPNPFNPSCELRFSLPATGASTSLAIYDLSGRHLVTLFSGRADGCEHSLRWDGRDERGGPMCSGVYFARLQVGAESQCRKLVVLK